MAYKCKECKHIFEYGEEKMYIEPHGEMWHGCPICKGEYEETERCLICGSEQFGIELCGGVCQECIDEYRSDFDMCYKISSEEKEVVKINSLLASIFEPEEIERILITYVKKNKKDISCDSFIDSDISWFGEKLAKEVNK